MSNLDPNTPPAAAAAILNTGDPAALAAALRRDLALPSSAILVALADPLGGGYSMVEAVRACANEDGLGLSPEEIADLLYGFDGLNLSMDDTTDMLAAALCLSREAAADIFQNPMTDLGRLLGR